MSSLLASDHALSIHQADDALGVISSGLAGCIFSTSDLHPDFFELSNQLAGNAFQKFVNYRFPVAFILDEDHDYGERVEELVRDHQTHPYIRFFDSVAAAEAWLHTCHAQ